MALVGADQAGECGWTLGLWCKGAAVSGSARPSNEHTPELVSESALDQVR